MILVQKKNVQYRIREESLAAYKRRGFEVVEQEKTEIFDKMTVAELLAFAEANGIDIPDKKANKPELLEAIRAAER